MASPILFVVMATGGCGGGECADGTVRHRDTCTLFDPFDKTPPVVTVDPPVRTRNVGNVRLTTDEPATIYVTTDDTTPTLASLNEPDQLVLADQPNDAIIRFFAVDLAGNQSAEQTVLWNIDQEGPAPPTGFALALTGATRTLTWQPPSDAHLGGVVVARVEGRLVSAPESGTRYAVGDVVGPGVTIVDVTGADATGTVTFTETATADPGMVRYVAWPFDDLSNYGAPAGDFALVPIPSQFGTLRLATANPAVTVLTPPSHVTLSGSAAFSGTTLTATIALRNDTTRTLFAPKVLVTSAIANATFSDPSGTLAGKPFKSYGAAILPGNQVTAQWTFTGVSAGATINLDVDIRDNQVMLANTRDRDIAGGVVDLGTGLELDQLAVGPTGARGMHGTRGGGFTPDGRIVFGGRTSASITSWDLATGKRLASTELIPQKGHIAQLVLDRGGTTGYALAGRDHVRKAYGNGGLGAPDTTLVRFDASTLVEHGRIELGASRNRGLVIAPDGRRLYIATGLSGPDGVLEVDLETFKIARHLATTTRSDTIALDGKSLVVVGTEVEIVDLATGSIARSIPLPQGQRALRAAIGDTHQLWIGRRNDTLVVDLADPPKPLQTLPFRGRALEVFDGKVFVGDATVQRVDFTGAVETAFTFNRFQGHWLGRSPF